MWFALTLLLPWVASQSNTSPQRGSAGEVKINGVDYNYYYLCGTFPNQYTSLYPCQSNGCKNCGNNNNNNCRRCTSGQYCRQFNRNWACVNGCCRSYNPLTTTTQRPLNPVCGGREVSGGYCNNGVCGTGFLCTSNRVCCRCATGTSIGPCVNGLCPDNFSCNSAGQCCATIVG